MNENKKEIVQIKKLYVVWHYSNSGSPIIDCAYLDRNAAVMYCEMLNERKHKRVTRYVHVGQLCVMEGECL